MEFVNLIVNKGNSKMNLMNTGNGKVVLLAGGGKCFTDIAARFVGSEKSLDAIVASPYDKKIVQNIINSGHAAATEFDYFVFGTEGYSRVTEVQLVRKRLASYLIKSGRKDKSGKRNFDIVIPKSIQQHSVFWKNSIWTTVDILELIEEWYNIGVQEGLPEEELRYLKPQATEFKSIIGMNCHALLDWWRIRCCKNAQGEIADLARKTLKLCKAAQPDLFAKAGANCKVLGYCPENKLQHKDCKGKIPTHNDVLKLIKNII